MHPEAQVGAGTVITGRVTIGPRVKVGAQCVIEGAPDRETIIQEDTVLDDFVKLLPGVVIGAGSRIGPYCLLGHPSKVLLTGLDASALSQRIRPLLVEQPRTIIGPGALIRSHGVIYSNVVIGDRFVTGHFIMVREHTRIGSRCVFGTHASVDGYCAVGDRSHIGQYCQLSQAACIGRGVFIGGHTVFSDNPEAIWDVEHDLHGAYVGDYVRIGLNCTILPDVVVGKYAFIGAGSVVTKNVPSRALAYGTPARVARTLTDREVQEYVDSVER